MELISHADDLGLSKSIDDAILQAAWAGHLSRVSCLVTHLHPTKPTPYALPSTIECCLHFNATEGTPIADPTTIPSLLNRAGQFYSLPAFLIRIGRGKIREIDLERELTAQLERFREIFGHYPTHLDSHQHSHLTRLVGNVLWSVGSKFSLETVRTAPLIVYPGTSGYTPRLLNHLLKSSYPRHRRDPHTPAALVDPRYLTHGTLAATLASLPSDSLVEVIWHLSIRPQDTWRHRQFEMIMNPTTWQELAEHRINLYHKPDKK